MRSRIFAAAMALVVASGFCAIHTSQVLAQNTPAAEDTSTTETAEEKAKKNVQNYRNKNDVLYYGEDTCSTSPAATVSGAGSDCKGSPLPDSIPEYWRNLIDNAAAKYPDTDRRAVAATLWVENRGWPDPKKNWATSGAGASGPWQFIPSSWASMGVDCNNDGNKNVNDPEDAVCAAFVHLKGSACKPIMEGATGDADNDYTTVPFKRDGNNTIISAIANYNGSGAADGTPLSQQSSKENSDYLKMAYWLLATDFKQTIDVKTGEHIDATKTNGAYAGLGGSGSGSTSSSSSSSCSSSGAQGSVIQIDGFNYSFPLAIGKNDVVHAGDAWPCPGPSVCHHDGTPAFDLFKKGRGNPGTQGTPVLAITDGKIDRLHTRNGKDYCYDWQIVGNDGWWYWYGHSAPPSIQNGSTVSAGQQLSTVGRTECADNSDPHLHVDRGSPKGHYGGVKCCRDQGFIPLLNEIHDRMPDSGVNL